MRDKDYAIGIDIGGTTISAAIVHQDGTIATKITRASEAAKGGLKVVEKVGNMIGECLTNWDSKSSLKAIGIGIPGVVEKDKGMAIDACDNIPDLKNISLSDWVHDKFGIPTFVDNDANLAALGEKRFGAGVGVDNLVCLTLGTGIGCGIILGGKLLRGYRGYAAEVAHISVDLDGIQCSCGNRGCLENYISAKAITDRVKTALKEGIESAIVKKVNDRLDLITPEVVFRAAREADKLALEIVAEYARYLSVGIVTIVNLLNPQMVVLAGGIAKAGEILLRRIECEVMKRGLPATVKDLKIVPAKLGDNAGMVGAATLALEAAGGKDI